MKRALLALLFVGIGLAQTSKTPLIVVSAAQLPATCSVGEVYWIVDAQPGNNIAQCTSTNVYTYSKPRTLNTLNSGTDILCANASDTNCSAHVATTETAFAQTVSLPASLFNKSGKTVRITFVFQYTSSASSPSIALKVKFGSTTLWANPVGAFNSSVTERSFVLPCTLQSAGAPGASVGVYGACVGLENTVAQPVNVATNAAQTLTVSLTYGTGDFGNWMHLTQIVVEELN